MKRTRIPIRSWLKMQNKGWLTPKKSRWGGREYITEKRIRKKKTVHCTKACLINANSFFSHPVEGTAKVVDYQVSYPIISSAYKNKDGHSSALVCDHFWDAPDKIYNLKIFSVTLVGACYRINSTRFSARNQPQLQIESQLVLLVFLADWIFHQIVHKPTECTVKLQTAAVLV